MGKPRITQIVSHELPGSRVDVLTIANAPGVHESVVSALLDLGLDENSALEFDADYTTTDADVLRCSDELKAHLVTQGPSLLLILESNKSKGDVTSVVERHFQVP